MGPIDYSRGRNNEVSKIAFEKSKVSHDVMRARIFQLIDGKRCTRQIEEMLKKMPNEISGRFTELARANRIYLVKKVMYKGRKFSLYAKVQ